MEDFQKIEHEIYDLKYTKGKKIEAQKKWDEVKNNKELLEWAITVGTEEKAFWANGLAICECMLIDYDNVDKEIYQKLVNSIFSNRKFARMVLDGYRNGGYSFLLMTLWNDNLKLTDEQKEFAVDEAMNKNGTIRNSKGNSLGDDQAHGTRWYDIRYYILSNPNWSLEEKKKLVMNFWASEESYSNTFEQWELAIVDDPANFKGYSTSRFMQDRLYSYTYDELLLFYFYKETTDRIWREIQFCKEMRELRPPQWIADIVTPKVAIKVDTIKSVKTSNNN